MKKYEISNPKQSLSLDGSRDTMLDTACDFLAPDLRPVPPQVSSVIIMYHHQISLFIRYHVSSCIIRYQPFSSLYCCLLTFPHRPHHHPNHQHHGPVSTIQKTGWVWSGLEKGFTYLWMRSLGRSQNPLSCVFGHFSCGDERTKKQTNEQTTD